MVACIGRGSGLLSPAVVLASFLLLSIAAHAQSATQLLGGPHGVVKSANGELLEGIMVQLIAQKNAIRTTATLRISQARAWNLCASNCAAARISSVCQGET